MSMYFDFMPGDLIGGDNIFMSNNSRAFRLATVDEALSCRISMELEEENHER